MLLGLAIYNSVHIDAKFPPVIYKKLLDEPLSLEDLKSFDKETYQSLKHVLEYEGDLENDLYVTFQIKYQNFGESQVFDLKVRVLKYITLSLMAMRYLLTKKISMSMFVCTLTGT